MLLGDSLPRVIIHLRLESNLRPLDRKFDALLLHHQAIMLSFMSFLLLVEEMRLRTQWIQSVVVLLVPPLR